MPVKIDKESKKQQDLRAGFAMGAGFFFAMLNARQQNAIEVIPYLYEVLDYTVALSMNLHPPAAIKFVERMNKNVLADGNLTVIQRIMSKLNSIASDQALNNLYNITNTVTQQELKAVLAPIITCCEQAQIMLRYDIDYAQVCKKHLRSGNFDAPKFYDEILIPILGLQLSPADRLTVQLTCYQDSNHCLNVGLNYGAERRLISEQLLEQINEDDTFTAIKIDGGKFIHAHYNIISSILHEVRDKKLRSVTIFFTSNPSTVQEVEILAVIAAQLVLMENVVEKKLRDKNDNRLSALCNPVNVELIKYFKAQQQMQAKALTNRQVKVPMPISSAIVPYKQNTYSPRSARPKLY